MPRSVSGERILSPNFLLLLTGGFGFYTSMWLVMTYLPPYVLHIGGRESDIGLVLSAFAFTALLSRPIVGRMADTLGRKVVALAGCAVFALAPILYTVTSAVPVLIAVRMFHGLGISLFGTAGIAWVADIVSPNRRAEAMGLYSNTSQVAIAIAPLLGTLIFSAGSFQMLFPVAALAGTAGLLLVGLAREDRRTSGLATSAGSFRQALGRPEVLAMTFGLMTAAATWAILIAFLPIFTVQRHAGPTAPFFTIYAVATVVLRLLIGSMADRIGRRAVVGPALLLLAVTMFAFNLLSSPYVLYGLAIVYALGFGTIYPTLSAFLVDVVPANARGSAIGVLTAGFDLGIMVGSYIGGLVAERLGLGMAFTASGVLCLVGLGVFWGGTRERRNG